MAFGQGRVAVEDLLSADGATEFSLGLIGPYAIVDLTARERDYFAEELLRPPSRGGPR